MGTSNYLSTKIPIKNMVTFVWDPEHGGVALLRVLEHGLHATLLWSMLR
jgi:hypothetical protein